jgi:hypothetical protein
MHRKRTRGSSGSSKAAAAAAARAAPPIINVREERRIQIQPSTPFNSHLHRRVYASIEVI